MAAVAEKLLVLDNSEREISLSERMEDDVIDSNDNNSIEHCENVKNTIIPSPVKLVNKGNVEINGSCINIAKINNNNSNDIDLTCCTGTLIENENADNEVMKNNCNLVIEEINTGGEMCETIDKCNLKPDANLNVERNEVSDDEKCYDSSTDFMGLELALAESNVKEPFLEELCTKMGSVIKPPASIDVQLQNLTKDDSTDIDVSYSDSLSPESDQDIGSSFVDSSYQQIQEIESKYKNEIERFKGRITELEKESSHEECQQKISTLEKTVEQIRLELDLSQKEHGLDSRSFAKEKMELEAKVESLKRDYQAANKDREAAVVRYACGEMELMNQKKEKETSEKKLKDCIKEKEVLINKLKTLTNDKTRVCQMLDNKCSDLTNAQKEIDSLKEEVNSKEIKLKWLQNKLRTETDSRKELEQKVESLTSKIIESQKDVEKARLEAQDCIKMFQESEENKAYTLGQQLKEEHVKLMLIEHDRDEIESSRKQLQSDLDICRVRLQTSIDENNSLSLKVQTLEKERLEYEQNLSQLKQKTDSQSQSISGLQHSVKDMEALRMQLQCEQERVLSSQSEMERLRLSNSELIQDMESCRKREADMLEFTQKLTAKNVRLQSEFTAVEAKVQQLECEEAPLQKRIVELENKVSSLLKDLEKEKLQRTEESKVLARHLAEKTARVKTLESQVDELTNEIQLVKRKDAATIKELNRELVHLRRRTEHNESGSGSESLCHGSRASSCTSLNEHTPNVPAQVPSVSIPSVLQVEPNRQILIERIGKLQRENVKGVEKIDFLEEHTRTLVEELQKKSKLLQSYILREEAGALSSSSMDLNKAELAKHGGIMASVYGSKAVDDNMTLDLSLEINKKLQAILEDTLLKNITLKENIDTLGDEIARLSQRRQHS